MSSETVIYIIISGIIALFIALFQYKYKAKLKHKTHTVIFTFLRFLSVFSVLLLLVNPKFNSVKYHTEKPNLVILADNSSSIKHLKRDAQTVRIFNSLKNNTALQNKFNIATYVFGSDLKASDSLQFEEKETNIHTALQQIAHVYKNTNTPTVLITDGNQTYGNDYQFITSRFKQRIYPVIVGDTVTYTDIKIEQLNVNKYAYLKNRFPIEAILVYKGNATVNTKLQIYKGATVVHSEAVRFSKANNSKIVNLTLPANSIGTNTYSAKLVPLENEKNTINNVKNFAVNVIDQKTNIAIVTNILHPDVGALKKSIESNEQRAVSIVKPETYVAQQNDFQLAILYQPDADFKHVYTLLNSLNLNRLVVIGTKTNLAFVNENTSAYSHELLPQIEEYQANFNSNYVPFQIDNIDFESFPPLQSNYGSVNFYVPYQNILTKRVGDVATKESLLATIENEGRREAVLFGENIWKWRAQSYLNTKSFTDFDNFTGRLVQYLATAKKRNRLNVDFESFYIGNSNVVINAQFFDKNYVFDTRETLTITVANTNTDVKTEFPLVLKNNNYQVDLSSLQAGSYNFTVKAHTANISKSGSFTILEYHVEQQFLNANVTKLQLLATNSNGKGYFIDSSNALAEDLINDQRYTAIQKSTKTTIPLIDWKILLAIIALALSAEWFLRKYNGLI